MGGRAAGGNRQRFFDPYAALLLLYFFNPIRTSLRGLQQASGLDKVQQRLGGQATSLGALSEAARVLDAAALQEVFTELAGRVPPAVTPAEQQALKDRTAVDGSLLPARPRLAGALGLDDSHRAAPMHLAFAVLRGIPVGVTVTAGTASAYDQRRALLQAGRLDGIDRGTASYPLFQDLIAAKSSLIGRRRVNAVGTVSEERPVSATARAAGVRRDRVVHLGGPQRGAVRKPKGYATLAWRRGGHGPDRRPRPARGAA